MFRRTTTGGDGLIDRHRRTRSRDVRSEYLPRVFLGRDRDIARPSSAMAQPLAGGRRVGWGPAERVMSVAEVWRAATSLGPI